MNSLVCVDASFVVKLVIFEPESQVARALWADWMSTGTRVCAPVLLPFEAASTVRKQAQRRAITPEAGDAALGVLVHLFSFVELVDPAHLIERAWAIASRYSLTVVHDASYVALADLRDADLWTGDGRMLRSMPQHAGRIKALTAQT